MLKPSEIQPDVSTPAGGAGVSSAEVPRAGTTGITLRLLALRQLMRGLLLTQRVSWIAAVVLTAAIAWGMIDFGLRMPGWLRGVGLAIGLAVLAVALYRRIKPVLGFKPSLADLALRLEASPDGQRVGLGGVLASGLELAEGPSAPLAQPVVRQAGQQLARLTPMAVLKLGPTVVAASMLALALMTLSSVAFMQPGLTATGARRVLTPWSDVSWPKRAAIADVMEVAVHPLGTALPLRAALLTGDAERVRVQARYRLLDESGEAGPTRRVVLTDQGRQIAVPPGDDPMTARPETGVLMEQLLEPAALELDARAEAPEALLEYWFESDDDQTAARQVRLVRPPRVVSATAVVTPPAYAAALGVGAQTIELGAGVDERATLPDVLAGSRVELTIELSKDVPAVEADREAIAEALGEGFAAGVLEEQKSATIELSGRRWTLAWEARGNVSIRPAPVDQYGVASDSESAFRVVSREDRGPEAAVLLPSEDVQVLPTAKVDVSVEGRDDLGLARVEALARAAKPRAGSESKAAEATEDERTLGTATPTAGSAARVLTVASVLDLPALGAKAGEEYWLTALAADTHVLNGEPRAPTRSAVRKVRVISPDQLAEQVWAELSAVRRSAINLAEQQDRLREALARTPESTATGLARDQAAVSEGLVRQQQAVQRQAERIARNQLNNEELAGVLESAKELLESAREGSTAAQEVLRSADAAQRENRPAESSAKREQAGQAQAQAQRALEDLAQALDQGQDAWSARRGIERLKRDQQSIRDQTAKLGQQTVGRAAEELTAAERAAAGELAQQQDDLGQRAQDAIDKLRQQAEQLKERDPSTAQALEQAASRAQRAQVPEQIARVGEQIRQNRQQAANQQQDSVVKALEQMLEQMNQAGRDRDERLSRELASLIESIQGLIARQKQEIDALDAGVAKNDLSGLDTALIGLRTQTLAVGDQARSAGREMQAIAGQIEQAAAAQASAIGRLRAEPAEAAAAREFEVKALEHLESAVADAQKSQQQAQDRSTRRQRGELRRAYAELLAEQTDLRARANDAAGLEAGRRQRAAARELSQPQDDLRRKTADLQAKTKDIGESELFKFAHQRIDEAMGRAAAALGEGQTGPGVSAAQTTSVRVLQSLIDALGDSQQEKDPFREQEQEAGGGGGGGQPPGLIPPTAELRLLRIMQEEALEATKAAEAVGDEAGRRRSMVEAGRLQGDLAERAEALLKKLQEEQGGGGAKPGERARPAPPGGGS